VGSIETLLSIDAAEKIDPDRRSTSRNRELFAQGTGNMISGFLGGLPITAVIVRTSANISAGSKSKLSTIFHGIWIFACIDLIPDLLNFIPLASLACILLLTGYKLCKPIHFLEMQNRGWDQLIIFCTTIVAILATDLLKGIIVGIVISIILEIKKMNRSPVKVLQDDETFEIEFVNHVAFFHKARMINVFASIPNGKKVILKNMSVFQLHIDIRELIVEKKVELEMKNIFVTMT
jgi:MFS superfamily sulfate permease-like transporter